MHTFSLAFSALDVGVGICLLVNTQNSIDRVGRVSELSVTIVTSERETPCGTDLWTGTAAIATNLGLLCSLVTHNPNITVSSSNIAL